jgi:hypothetical protein
MSTDELLLPTVTDIDGTEVVRAIRSDGQVVQIPVAALLGDGSTPGSFSTLTASGAATFSAGASIVGLATAVGSPAYQLYLKKASASWGCLLGSPADNEFAVLNSAGVERLRIDAAGFIIPAALADAADDAAAATASVPVGALYRTGGTLKVRIV